eukprot:2252416-Prymnesium_polylepis.1
MRHLQHAEQVRVLVEEEGAAAQPLEARVEPAILGMQPKPRRVERSDECLHRAVLGFDSGWPTARPRGWAEGGRRRRAEPRHRPASRRG